MSIRFRGKRVDNDCVVEICYLPHGQWHRLLPCRCGKCRAAKPFDWGQENDGALSLAASLAVACTADKDLASFVAEALMQNLVAHLGVLYWEMTQELIRDEIDHIVDHTRWTSTEDFRSQEKPNGDQAS